jgi:tRNA(Ile2)-agmatinylcytidine synthase
VQLHIGIDDTDSPKGGCTTYVAARLVQRFTEEGVQFIDYPNIIRLNPNIPYKTRGNAAVALRLKISNALYETVQETVIRELEETSQIGEPNADPAAVFSRGVPDGKICEISRRSLWDVVSVHDALRVIKASKALAVCYGSHIGLVGATAAIGQTLRGDHTFEFVAYRKPENWGTPRRVSERSVKDMDRATAPTTFNSYDYKNRRILITPHGPDPVLLGIRGESPRAVFSAFRLLEINEPVERWVIFRTNHGTDAHLETDKGLRLNAPAVLSGTVSSRPEKIRGGHVFFSLACGQRKIECAAFEPTGEFRNIVSRLIPGDKVIVYGGVKKKLGLPVTLNLEKLQVSRLADEFRLENPTCPKCEKRMKSAGKAQGYRCEKCSSISTALAKRKVRRRRALRIGIYVPDLKANRHLTKPLSRYGRENYSYTLTRPSGVWHSP